MSKDLSFFCNRLSLCLAEMPSETLVDLREYPPPSMVLIKELVELISVEAERSASNGGGPGDFIKVLLLKNCAALTPLAAERHGHATSLLAAETSSSTLAELCPIEINRKVIIAAPSGNFSDNDLERFFDRLLALLLNNKKKKVVLLLSGLIPSPNTEKIISNLESDLKKQRITIENINFKKL